MITVKHITINNCSREPLVEYDRERPFRSRRDMERYRFRLQSWFSLITNKDVTVYFDIREDQQSWQKWSGVLRS